MDMVSILIDRIRVRLLSEELSADPRLKERRVPQVFGEEWRYRCAN